GVWSVRHLLAPTVLHVAPLRAGRSCQDRRLRAREDLPQNHPSTSQTGDGRAGSLDLRYILEQLPVATHCDQRCPWIGHNPARTSDLLWRARCGMEPHSRGFSGFDSPDDAVGDCASKAPSQGYRHGRARWTMSGGAMPVKPNVVIFVADDLGWGDLGCYGSSAIPTPNIDELAMRGARFVDCHATSAVCTPSRFS